MPNTSRSTLLAVCLAIVYVVWGSTYLAIHFVVDGMPPLISSAIRNLCAGPILFAFLKWRGAAWPTSRQWRNGALIGFMMMGLGNGFVCLAETSVPSGLAALVVAGVPVFAILFAWGLSGARPRLLEWLGIALGLAGMALLNLDLHAAASPGAVAVLFVAAASWACATVLQPRLDMPAGPMSAAVQMLGGGASLVVMSALRGERLVASAVPASAWLALAYLVVFGSIVAYTRVRLRDRATRGRRWRPATRTSTRWWPWASARCSRARRSAADRRRDGGDPGGRRAGDDRQRAPRRLIPHCQQVRRASVTVAAQPGDCPHGRFIRLHAAHRLDLEQGQRRPLREHQPADRRRRRTTRTCRWAAIRCSSIRWPRPTASR